MRVNPRHTKHTGQRRIALARMPHKVVAAVLGALCGLLLSVIVVFGASAINVFVQGNRVLDATQNLADAALGCGGDVDLSHSASELVSSTRSLRDELDKPQWTFLRDHTSYGNDITAARTILDSVGNLVDGPFTDLTELSTKLSGFSMKHKSVDLSALVEVPDIIHTAHDDIGVEVAKLKALQQPKIGKVDSLVKTAISGLESVDGLLSQYTDMADLIPTLLGENGERTYLVAVQNPSELRSAGGMVGNVAAITADHGRVTIGDFETTGDWENPSEAFDDQGVLEAAIFGDQIYKWPQTTTVNPYYPRVAKTFKKLWQHQSKNKGTKVAGVIMVDPVFLQTLVGAIGGVQLDDGTMLDGTNTVKFFGEDVYLDHPEFEDQNKYVSNAAKTIMNSIVTKAGPSTASSLLKAIRDTSEQSHLKIWMTKKAEFNAMVKTGLINRNAEGALPGTAENPVAGIYFTEAHASKMSWYLKTDVSVTKTCGDGYNAWNSRLTDKVDARPRSTMLGVQSSAELGDEYTVEVTVHNAMTKHQSKTLPDFVTGVSEEELAEGYKAGDMGLRLVLLAPTNGSITTLAYEDGELTSNGSLYERQFLNLRLPNLAPGKSATVAFTVRVSSQAANALDVVTTPIINASGMYTGTDGKVTDECAADDGQESSGDDGQADGSQDGASQDGSQDGASQADGSQDGQNDGSQQQAADPSEGLNALDALKSQLSCPVDLRKMLL